MMSSMRTTVRIEDELLEQLKEQARKERVSLTRLINRTLEAGLRAGGAHRPKRTAYREQPHALGAAAVPLDSALALAAALEDDEIARKLALRK
jgi:hypothetical protein